MWEGLSEQRRGFQRMSVARWRQPPTFADEVLATYVTIFTKCTLGCAERIARSVRFIRGDQTKAKAVYEHFLALWKDANRDVPILKSAKPEYARP